MTKASVDKTSIAMVLDRSGSMSSCQAATIDAVNKYLLEARQDQSLKESDFELLTFDSESIDSVRSGAPVNVADISAEDYIPRGSTPLYDAIGRGISSLDGKTGTGGKAILVIVTDGMENASRKHSHGSISELIKARQASGWLVVFLGAGIDAAQQGAQLGVRAAYTASIGTDAASLSAVSRELRMASSSYSSRPAAEARAFAATSSFSAGARGRMGDASAGSWLNKTRMPTQKATAPVQYTGTAVPPVATDAWGGSEPTEATKLDLDAWSQ